MFRFCVCGAFHSLSFRVKGAAQTFVSPFRNKLFSWLCGFVLQDMLRNPVYATLDQGYNNMKAKRVNFPPKQIHLNCECSATPSYSTLSTRSCSYRFNHPFICWSFLRFIVWALKCQKLEKKSHIPRAQFELLVLDLLDQEPKTQRYSV